MDESAFSAVHYDKVYIGRTSELFFKATANRVSGP